MDSKETMINKLTLLDTAMYRATGYTLTGKLTHEPSGFRVQLHEIYSKLSEDDINKLLKLKEQ
jgi:hypothetical protein